MNLALCVNPVSRLTPNIMFVVISVYPLGGYSPSSPTSNTMLLFTIYLSISYFQRVLPFFCQFVQIPPLSFGHGRRNYDFFSIARLNLGDNTPTLAEEGRAPPYKCCLAKEFITLCVFGNLHLVRFLKVGKSLKGVGSIDTFYQQILSFCIIYLLWRVFGLCINSISLLIAFLSDQ